MAAAHGVTTFGAAAFICCLVLAAAASTENLTTQMFDFHEQQCCNGTVHDRKRGWDCCGTEYINPQETGCCHDQVVPYPNEHDDRFGCCFDQDGVVSSFDPERQQCCGGKVLDKPDEDVDFYGCCNGSLFVETEQICCGDKVVPYDPNAICCDGQQVPAGPTSMCCGGQHLVDTESQLCCQSMDVTQKRLLYAVHNDTSMEIQCCGLLAINISAGVCCHADFGHDSYVLPLPPDFDGSRPFRCCDQRIISNLTEEFCCGGEVHGQAPGALACCGPDLSYDPQQQICCGDRLYNSSDNVGKVCCVPSGSLFDPEVEQCCGQQVVAISDDDKAHKRNQCCAPLQSVASGPTPLIFEEVQFVVKV